MVFGAQGEERCRKKWGAVLVRCHCPQTHVEVVLRAFTGRVIIEWPEGACSRLGGLYRRRVLGGEGEEDGGSGLAQRVR